MLSNNENLYLEIKEIIEGTRRYIAKKINSSMTIAYWSIGKIIREEFQIEKRANYGKETLKKLSQQLTLDFGNGFSYRNILRMVKFYEFIPDRQKVTTLSAQLTWSHFVELIKLDDEPTMGLILLQMPIIQPENRFAPFLKNLHMLAEDVLS